MASPGRPREGPRSCTFEQKAPLFHALDSALAGPCQSAQRPAVLLSPELEIRRCREGFAASRLRGILRDQALPGAEECPETLLDAASHIGERCVIHPRTTRLFHRTERGQKTPPLEEGF